MNKVNFKNLYSSWLKDQVKNNCQIKLGQKEMTGTIAECYQEVFSGEPFYENWTKESAEAVIEDYLKTGTTIRVAEIDEKAVGFLVATDVIPEDQKPYIPYNQEEIRFIEEIGVSSKSRGNNIASELVRGDIISSLERDKNYIGYRTNAMRWLIKWPEESFETAIERTQKEDATKRIEGEPIIIPTLSEEEKQEFINQYIELLEKRPDLDVSDSSKLFRGIGFNVEFCKIGNNYTWQKDPTGENNDRIFPVLNLKKAGYSKTYYNKKGQR